MSNEYSVVKIVVPAIGEKVPSHAAGLAKMGVTAPSRAYPGDSTYLLKIINTDVEANVVFFNENSKRWDYLSSVPAGENYILEQWEGHRVQADIGFVRHTFVKRSGQNGYVYFGQYAIKALFEGESGQITLWQRA